MRRLLLIVPLAAGALAGCAPTVAETRAAEERQSRDEARLSRALAGLTPGQPQSCLSGQARRIARVENIGGTLLFRIDRDRVFRNNMNGNCASNARDPIFVTQTPTSALCRGDITQLLDRAARFPIGSCSYGDFVPYTRAR